MRYENEIVRGVFLSRPNRFIAHVALDGETVVCHVKNTGRCRELLLPGAQVYLERASDCSKRKTAYDLIAVKKGERLFNIDSNAPNAAVLEYLKALYGDQATIRAEKIFSSSRFDFYVELPDQRIFIEVKGVTLEENGIASFPDAPTQRGCRHLRELCLAVEQGYRAQILFVIQMEGMRGFCPNDQRDPAFGRALRQARLQGVQIKALCCEVTPEELKITGREIPLLF